MSAVTAPTLQLRPLLARLAAVLEDKPLDQRSTPFTLDEIAARWHTTAKQVERLCAAGKLKSFKPGRHRLVRPVALAKYERDREEPYGGEETR